MRILILILPLLLNAFMFVGSSAQEMPLVYDVESTCADCPTPYLPSFGELPNVHNLPDPFRWSDGRGRIANFSDWPYRRAEIKAEIEYYEIGEKPTRPDSIEASYSDGALTVDITVNGNTLTLTSPVILPEGEGPFPAVIGMGGPTGSLPADIFASRNIAQIAFNFGQVMAHTQTRGQEPINTLYPELIYIGAYSAWSWGVSRLIDGLELVSEDLNIDLKHLAVTGCSFAGKMALFAGAFDERIALTIAQESGGGGYTTWRFSETLGNVETLSRTSHAWFIEDMFQFANDVPKLPYDHHELMAMVAPRALLVTGNPDYTWLADESGHVGSKAAKEVWNALGVPDRFGFSIVSGHPHCLVPNSQIPEIEAFVEKFLLGNDSVNTDISTTPYTTNLSSWITWPTPTLSDGASYFGKTSLVSPLTQQTQLDTSLTFVWNHVEDAEKYLIQLSTNPIFTMSVISDSTTDTLKTITNLEKGEKYYWRVGVKNAAGYTGPWSDIWNFSTFIQLPAAPQLISTAPYPNRTGYVTFTWGKVDYADDYAIQLARQPSFQPVYRSASTADTAETLSGIAEGQTYYWRVQGRNVAGSGPWSDVSDYVLILPPTDLTLERSASTEITLTWRDNSSVEDGYIIERKQSQQSSFTVLDTLEGSGSTYQDGEVELEQTYTYRVKAYKDSAVSVYSNEASLLITSIRSEEGIPTEYSMSQNYPNPFNPSTKIRFALPKAALTKITIYDILGKEVRVPVNRKLEAGRHEVNIDAGNLPNGVYVYRIQSGDFIDTKKMILLK